MAIPIPKRPSGYRLGNAEAPVVIEMFFDLECPFSKQSWQTVRQVTGLYQPEQVCWILQPMTLSNHRQSWDATKAAIATAGDDPQKFANFVSYVFDHQQELAEDAFKEKTQIDLHYLLANYALASTPWKNKDQFLELMNSEAIYTKARIPARVAATRGVWSTPTFFINGAEAIQLSSRSSVKDWQTQLNSLLMEK